MKQIYHLIAFPAEWLNGQALWAKANERTATEDDRKAFYDWKEQNQIYWYNGRAFRGTFDDKEKLVQLITTQNDPWGLCEGYYEYLCIQPSKMNLFDDFCMPEEEVWFKASDPEEEEFKYRQIDRPKCLDGVMGFV